MRFPKWLAVASALVLIASCFLDWITIPGKTIVVSGVEATGTNFGKPGYFHFFTSFFFIVLTLIPRVWAKRWNLFVVGLNTGWAIRNFLVIPACFGGICPNREIGIYLMGIASLLMLIAALFPDMKLLSESPSQSN